MSTGPSTRDPRTLVPAYLLTVLAATVLAATLVPSDQIPTLIATVGSWAIPSIALGPGRRHLSHGLLVAATVMLMVRGYSGLPVEARVVALVGVGVCLSVFVLRPLRTYRRFPFLHLLCLVQASYLYLGALLGQPKPDRAVLFPTEVRTTGIVYTVVFFTVLVIAALAVDAALGRRGPAPDPADLEQLSPVSLPRAYLLAAGAAALAAVLTVSGLGSQLGTGVELIRLVGMGGLLLLVLRWLNGDLGWVHKLVLAGALSGYVLWGLGLGILYEAARPGFLVLALYLVRRRSVPWLLVLGAMLAFVVLNIGKAEYRMRTWERNIDGTVAQDRAISSTASGLDYLTNISETYGDEENAVSVAAYRFSNADLLGYFVTNVPSRYPHYGLSSYTSLPVVLVPRILYPDKPTYATANEIGRRYELIAEFDLATSVNTPIAAEAYVAAGPTFFVLVAVGTGAFISLLAYWLRSLRPATVLTGCLLCFQLLQTIESGIFGLFLIVPYAVLLYPVMRWAAGPVVAREPAPTGITDAGSATTRRAR